jgi:hypothetical protein
MSSSGQLVTSREDHRECHVAAQFVFATVDYGCGFAGLVEIIDDPETLTATWICPHCGVDHSSDIGT